MIQTKPKRIRPRAVKIDPELNPAIEKMSQKLDTSLQNATNVLIALGAGRADLVPAEYRRAVATQ